MDSSVLPTTADVWNTPLGNSSTFNPNAFLSKLNVEATIRHLPVILFLVILMLIGIVGNVTVIVVFYQRKRKSDCHVFILNLAILDFLTCALGIPFEITDLCFAYTFYASVPCKIVRVLESWTTMASVLILVIISIDRHKHICKYGEHFRRKKVIILCIIAICVGGLLSWPLLIFVGRKTIKLEVPDIYGVDCSVSDEMGDSIYPLIYYGLLMCCFVLCLVFVIIVYVRISIFIRRKKAALKNHHDQVDGTQPTFKQQNMTSTDPQSIDQSQSRVNCFQKLGSNKTTEVDPGRPNNNSGVHVSRLTLIFVAITIAFVISYLPFLLTMLLRILIEGFERKLSPSLQVLFKFCLKTIFINNAINPVIYGFMCKQFREDVKRLFTRCQPRQGLSASVPLSS